MATDPTTDRQGIPDPSWRRPPKRAVNRRAPLTRQVIVDAALRLLDREGLDAVSMRRVAADLGTGAASLYWHVSDKEELLDLVFDRAIGEIEIPTPHSDRWQGQVKDVLRDERRMLARHRDLARVALGRWPLGPNALLFSEGLLAILHAGALPARVCAYAGQLLPSYVGWFALEERIELRSPAMGAASPKETLDMTRAYLASLPAERFPTLLALVDDVTADDQDERFEFGIDLLVRGLVTQAT